jgi:hypothetical protein
MHGVMHFVLVAGATAGAIQLAHLVMDQLNIEMAAGFGIDDMIEAVLVALGVTVSLSLFRSVAR